MTNSQGDASPATSSPVSAEEEPCRDDEGEEEEEQEEEKLSAEKLANMCGKCEARCCQYYTVLIQTPEYGGGEIYFDGKLIRQDGRFLPDDLQPLNEGLSSL